MVLKSSSGMGGIVSGRSGCALITALYIVSAVVMLFYSGGIAQPECGPISLEPKVLPSLVDKTLQRRYPNPCFPLANSTVACLPNFVIIGAMKAGTTFLDFYLHEHPMVASHTIKEVFFFSHFFSKGIAWYSSKFGNYELGDGKLIGEGTPIYMGAPYVPERMYLTIPKVKLILNVRDPALRTVSQYWHSLKWLRVRNWTLPTQTFEELLEEEVQLFRHCNIYPEDQQYFPIFAEGHDGEHDPHRFYDECWKNCDNCFPEHNSIHSKPNPMFGLLTKSIYYDQTVRWFKFFPREQMHVVRYEDINENPSKLLYEVETYLDLEHHDFGEFAAKNENDYPDPDLDLLKKLVRFFTPHTKRLEKLFGKSFNWLDADKM